MNTKKVRDLVDRWADERVEIEKGAEIKVGVMIINQVVTNNKVVIKSGEAFGNFIKWLKEQKDWGFVEPYQWSSAMKQRGFKPEPDGDDWVIRGIKLKDD